MEVFQNENVLLLVTSSHIINIMSSCSCLVCRDPVLAMSHHRPEVRRHHPYTNHGHARSAVHHQPAAHDHRPEVSRHDPYTNHGHARAAAHHQPAHVVYNPGAVKPEEIHEIREEQVYADTRCRLCSDSGLEIKHHHVSSQAVRDLAGSFQGGYLFQCIMCRKDESIVRPSTRKLLLTDSSMYNVWKYHEMQLLDHMDMETIVGGRVRDLTRALMMQYLKYPERLEIILIAGLNNVGEGQSAPDILDELCELKETVKAHSMKHKHEEPSVVSIATVLYAPRFCALDIPKNFPEWFPPAGFINRRNTIECLNAAIAALNKSDKVNYINLHFEGIKICKKEGTKMHKHQPVQPVWRELQVRRKLHLTPKYKVKLMGRVAVQWGVEEPG